VFPSTGSGHRSPTKQSPLKQDFLHYQRTPFKGRLLRHTVLRSVQGSAARNDIFE
jgi:hypothetical protein